MYVIFRARCCDDCYLLLSRALCCLFLVFFFHPGFMAHYLYAQLNWKLMHCCIGRPKNTAFLLGPKFREFVVRSAHLCDQSIITISNVVHSVQQFLLMELIDTRRRLERHIGSSSEQCGPADNNRFISSVNDSHGQLIVFCLFVECHF